MSWFSEFSEKAENILNTIDRNAAKALNKPPNAKSSFSDGDSSICLDIPSTERREDVQSELSNSFSNHQNTADLFPKKSRVESTKEVHINVADSQLNSSAVEKKFVYENLRSEMLQNEIHSLNNEISLLLNRAKLEEQKSRDLSAQLNISKEKNVKLEEQLADLRSRRYSNNEICDSTPKIAEDKTIYFQDTVDDNDSSRSNFHEHYDAQIQELLQEKNALMDTLREKEDEIILLKSRLSKKTYCFSADELQSRLRALTITLVEKQSAVESLIQEKNSLLNKLNHLQGRYEEALGILKQSRINVNDTDDVKALIPGYGSNGNIGRQIGKWYSVLTRMSEKNKFSLRKVSIWRLSLIIYIIFMHGLVFLLLYSHAPDSTDVKTKD